MFTKADESGGYNHTSLMNYRASPINGIGVLQWQLLMNRQLCTKLPILSDLLNSKSFESANINAHQEKKALLYDRQSATLTNINNDEIICVQKDSK